MIYYIFLAIALVIEMIVSNSGLPLSGVFALFLSGAVWLSQSKVENPSFWIFLFLAFVYDLVFYQGTMLATATLVSSLAIKTVLFSYFNFKDESLILIFLSTSIGALISFFIINNIDIIEFKSVGFKIVLVNLAVLGLIKCISNEKLQNKKLF